MSSPKFQVVRRHRSGPEFPNGAAATDYVGCLRQGDLPGVSYEYDIRGQEGWCVYRVHPVCPARDNLADCVEDINRLQRDDNSIYPPDSDFHVREACNDSQG